MNPMKRAATIKATVTILCLLLLVPATATAQDDVPPPPEDQNSHQDESAGGDGGTQTPSEVASDPDAGNVNVTEDLELTGDGPGTNGSPESSSNPAPSGPVDPCQYDRYDQQEGGVSMPSGAYMNISVIQGRIGEPTSLDALLVTATCPREEGCPAGMTAISPPSEAYDHVWCADWSTEGGTTDACTYATYTDPTPGDMVEVPGIGSYRSVTAIIDQIGEAPDDDMLLQIAQCPTAGECPGEELPQSGIVVGSGSLYVDCASWVTAAEATLTPEDLAERLLANIDELLPTPEVEMSPEDGEPWIVHAPVFLHVSNWDPVILGPECDGALCVNAVAEPSQITFESGEPDADLLNCTVPGVLYDPAGPEWEVQANTPDACVFYYTQRSGVGDRPEEWPGALMVTWTVTWTSTVSDEPQAYEPDPTTAVEVSREINEVQAVVTG